MKQYDHEPTMTELFDQLGKEYAYAPDFIPIAKKPIIGKFISKMIGKQMIETFIEGLLA